MRQKSVVTVSRRWHNPHIKTVITNDGISLSMSMDDFEEALIREIGSVTFTLTERGFRDKVRKAIDKVLYGVKEESAKVVETW